VIALSKSDHAAGCAFDSIAADYDHLFTNSKIGRAQRAVVWERAACIFPAGSHILELNCGTGEDAAFLAGKGIEVTACDASALMIDQARSRQAGNGAGSMNFHLLPSECLHELPFTEMFDGILSNFSGLNCIADLAPIAAQLAGRLKPNAPALLCLSTRFCVWEMLHYLLHGDLHRAFRRCAGVSEARIGSTTFPVYYPTLNSLSRSFHPFFRIRSVIGIGICVPPSYMETWAIGNPRLFGLCEAVDSIVRTWPGIRVLGDHMLLHMERS
jgi:SAM-dependent methyltransferase